jgi:hypothetical protein
VMGRSELSQAVAHDVAEYGTLKDRGPKHCDAATSAQTADGSDRSNLIHLTRVPWAFQPLVSRYSYTCTLCAGCRKRWPLPLPRGAVIVGIAGGRECHLHIVPSVQMIQVSLTFKELQI